MQPVPVTGPVDARDVRLVSIALALRRFASSRGAIGPVRDHDEEILSPPPSGRLGKARSSQTNGVTRTPSTLRHDALAGADTRCPRIRNGGSSRSAPLARRRPIIACSAARSRRPRVARETPRPARGLFPQERLRRPRALRDGARRPSETFRHLVRWRARPAVLRRREVTAPRACVFLRAFSTDVHFIKPRSFAPHTCPLPGGKGGYRSMPPRSCAAPCRTRIDFPGLRGLSYNADAGSPRHRLSISAQNSTSSSKPNGGNPRTRIRCPPGADPHPILVSSATRWFARCPR